MKRSSAAFIFILLLFSLLWADVPPEPGFKRVTVKLVVEAADDFPEYRFFVRSGADVREVTLKKGVPQTIEPLGGGAWYRSCGLLAVPVKSLTGLSEAHTDGKLSDLQKAVYDGKAEGTFELVKHSFTREVRERDVRTVQDAVYMVEKDRDHGLKATIVSGNLEESGTSEPGASYYSRDVKTGLFWATVAGGSLMTMALIALGVWFIRRSRTNAVQ